MRAVIQKLNWNLPYCDAKTAHDILFVFRPPTNGLLHVGDPIEINQNILDTEQTAMHIPTGEKFKIEIRKNDVHDLRLPCKHGSSRFPSPERFCEA